MIMMADADDADGRWWWMRMMMHINPTKTNKIPLRQSLRYQRASLATRLIKVASPSRRKKNTLLTSFVAAVAHARAPPPRRSQTDFKAPAARWHSRPALAGLWMAPAPLRLSARGRLLGLSPTSYNRPPRPKSRDPSCAPRSPPSPPPRPRPTRALCTCTARSRRGPHAPRSSPETQPPKRPVLRATLHMSMKRLCVRTSPARPSLCAAM